MFVGHFAVGFAAKAFAPRIKLATAFAAAQFLDLVWPIFLLLGVEHARVAPGITVMTPLDFYDYPYTHSLAAAAAWALAVGGAHFARLRDKLAAVVLAFAVLSHWFLDLVVHRPDLPLVPGSQARYGLGLWNFPAATIGVELALFVAAVAFYTKRNPPTGMGARIGLCALILALLGIWIGGFLGPPPPDQNALAVAGNAQWLFVLWAFWLERPRSV